VFAAMDDASRGKVVDSSIIYRCSLRLSFEAGSVGTSIRFAVPDNDEP
jgi:hypothetical protein